MKHFLLASLLAFIATSPLSFAQSGETLDDQGFGSIIIEQNTPRSGVFGSWTLIGPLNRREEGDNHREDFDGMKAGQYTVIFDPPEGAIGAVIVKDNAGTEVVKNNHPQASFKLIDGQEMHVKITYIFTLVGKVAVNSEPSGLDFRLEGPNDAEYKGTTPAHYDSVPVGLYTVYFDPIDNCVTPKPRSERLEKDSRIALSITVACEELDSIPQEQARQKSLISVTAQVDGKEVIFHDVPISSWFAVYVQSVLKTGISSGYTDSSGNPTGEFGPSNNVTLAELSKFAHKIAGIDAESERTETRNTRAKNTWFSKYFASAERRGWQVFQDLRLDPGRPATRAEVTTTILQALNVPRDWPTANMFRDVGFDTDYAASIETAANDGIVSGYKDDQGNPSGNFGPSDPINRAGLAKILSLAQEIYIENTESIQ